MTKAESRHIRAYLTRILVYICLVLLITVIIVSGFYPHYFDIFLVTSLALVFWIVYSQRRMFPALIITKKTNIHGPKARASINELANLANHSIDIYSGILSHDVFDDDEVLKSFQRALDKRDIKLRIIIEDDIDEKSSKFIELTKTYDVIIKITKSRVRSHFMVIDGKHVRIEYDKENKKATIRYDDLELALKAESIFEEMWDEKKTKPYDYTLN